MDTSGANKRRKLEAVQPSRIERMSILQLNVDCLLYLFSFLNITDLINAEKVCPKFKDLAKETYKTFKTLNIKEYVIDQERISPGEAVKIFRRVGPHISTLLLHKYTIRTRKYYGIPPSIWQFCKNLQTVYFYGFIFKVDICAKMSPALKNVTIAHLINCELDDDLLSELFNLRQLTEFTLTCNSKSTGHFLEQLHNIQKIDLYRSEIDPNLFVGFCTKNTQLLSLKICKYYESTRINANCIQAIARNLRNLECLHFTCDDSIQIDHYLTLMEMPKMKQLKFDIASKNYNDLDILLKKISAYNKLEYLEIGYPYRNLTEVPHTIGRFTNLKELKLINAKFCDDDTLELISEMKLLEKLHISDTLVTVFGLKKVIKRCQMIRYIDVCRCDLIEIHEDFIQYIPQILHYLKDRRHTLEIRVSKEDLLAGNYENNPRLLKIC